MLTLLKLVLFAAKQSKNKTKLSNNSQIPGVSSSPSKNGPVQHNNQSVFLNNSLRNATQAIELNKQRQVLKEAVNAKVKQRNKYNQSDEPANKIQRMLVLKQGEGPVLGICFLFE